MFEKTIKIINETGLHARPVTQFVQKCKAYNCDIFLGKGDKKVKGNSIISIMSLGIIKDDEITVSAEGPDSEVAVGDLSDFLATFAE